MAAIDPYAPPHAPVIDVLPANRAADTTRVANLTHETGVRAIGVACLVFGGVMLVFGAWSVFNAARYGAFSADLHGSRYVAGTVAFCAAMLAAGALGTAAAWGYFRLRPWVRWVAVPVALAAAIVSFGLASPLVLYAAWLTWSGKGRQILTPGYDLARAAGWPRGSQWGHAAAIVLVVGLYVVAFHAIVTADFGVD